VSLSLGYDINLARETARYTKSEGFNWRIFFGVTAAKSLSGLGPRPGTVYGTVTDRETGRPVAARITLRDSDVAAATDPETGLYSLEILSEGLLGLVIEAQGYKKRVVPAVAVPGERPERNIELTASLRLTRLRLVAEDRMSDEPVPAVFRLEGKEVHEVTADSSGSSGVLEVPSGEYELICRAPGYLRTKRRVEISLEQEEPLVFTLLKHGDAMVISGVGFVGSTANLKIESDTGVREVIELLHSNPEVRFEVAGHTDDTGSAEADSALSLKRALVFSRFLVKGYEIREERLVAKGYGATNPIGPNNTEEERKKNRRLEIRAL
jgi:outer membrane protein OmpA-like peptidoglycan-associated protein